MIDKSLANAVTFLKRARAWSVVGDDFDKVVHMAVRHAVLLAASEHQHILSPTNQKHVLLPDVQSSVVSRELEATSDRWVLRFTRPGGSALSTDPLGWFPNVAGLWDGRIWLEVTHPTTGRVYRRKSMEFFTIVNQNDTDYYVSLDRRWPNTTDTDLTFRLFQPGIWLRDDVMAVIQPAFLYDNTRRAVGKLSVHDAMDQDKRDYAGGTTATPSEMWREHEHHEILRPQTAPTLSAGQGAWAGPVQEGDWEVYYTYCHGKKDPEWQEANYSGVLDPLWESGPSPASAVYDQSASGANSDIIMQFPNIDAMRNFATATLRDDHSGWYIRIYVARKTIDTGATGGANDNDEASGIAYLLTEIDPDNTTPLASYTWTGALIPDMSRRLPFASKYHLWAFWPHQDARYEVEVPVVQLPHYLQGSNDDLPVVIDAVPAIYELSLYFMCLFDGVDQADAAAHRDRGLALLPSVTARRGNPTGVVESRPITRLWPHRGEGQLNLITQS